MYVKVKCVQNQSSDGYAVDDDICQGMANYSLRAMSSWQLVLVN